MNKEEKTHFLNPCAHINTCGIANVINNETVPEKNACNFETRRAKAIVIAATVMVVRTLIFGLAFGILLMPGPGTEIG